MPYNLRKRKAPEPVQEVKEVREAKKPRGRAKKPVVADDKKPPVADVKKSVVADNKKRVAAEDDKKPPVADVKKSVVADNKKRAAAEDDKKPIVTGLEKLTVADVQKPAVADTKKRAAAAVDNDKKPTVTDVKKHAEVGHKKSGTTDDESIDNRNLYIFGEDSCGEFGLKKIGFSRKTPTLVPIGHRVKQVACGPMHTIALTTAGDVYSFGCNDEGALGRVTEGEEEDATPTLVQLDHKIVKITAGDSHSAALSDDNKVFIWGNFRDHHGSVGLLPECNGEKTYKPIQILPEIKFKDIASGSEHMLLLDTKGVVYSFGVGSQGQLGRLKSEDVDIDEYQTHAITEENRELYLKPAPVSFKNVDSQRPFICDAIYAGNFSSFATNTDKSKNRLAGWGLNNFHQLGYKGQKSNQTKQLVPRRSTFTCSTSMVNVACGLHHTLFLTKSGRVYAAGKPLYGILGIGETKSPSVCPAKHIDYLGNTVTTIAASTNASFAATEDGKLYSWGMSGPSLGCDDEKDLLLPTEVTRLDGKRVKSISAGNSITAVLVE